MSGRRKILLHVQSSAIPDLGVLSVEGLTTYAVTNTRWQHNNPAKRGQLASSCFEVTTNFLLVRDI